MGKLDGKVAVITGGSSGLALVTAELFVDEGAYVFISGRRQEVLDEAVALIGRNVTGVQGDAANLDDLDRLFETVKREKGCIDVLSAAREQAKPASRAKSPRSSSIPPSASTRAARCSRCRRHCRYSTTADPSS